MKKNLILLALLVLVGGLAFASPNGEKPAETPAVQPAAEPSTTEPGIEIMGSGQVVTYVTIDAYEKATGNKFPSQFNESPVLKPMVASGKIPSLEQRLPEEPLVVVPANEIGRFGGTMRTIHVGSLDATEDLLREFPLAYTNDMTGIVGNLFKTWEVLDNGATYIFHLRKGIKWNDGKPFTVDDMMFYYSDAAMNTELYPQGIADLKVEGKMGVWEKIDDYTLKMSFVAPTGVLDEKLCRLRFPDPYGPAHYLKQFHPDYTPKTELDKKVKDASFDSWVQLFQDRWNFYDNPDIPTIFAWYPVNRQTNPVHQFVRNPYYWKVDPAGNQLPYIDGYDRYLMSDDEAMLLKFMAGEVDFTYNQRLGGQSNYSLLQKNTEQGGYKLYQSLGWPTIAGGVAFNYTHKDPEHSELFTNKDFRIALSLAINRDQVSEIVTKGIYKRVQVTLPAIMQALGEESNPKYNQYKEFDLDKANQILDELGLKWDNSHQRRVFPSGKPLQFVVLARTVLNQHEMAAMYKQYWSEIGIDITVKPFTSGALFNEQVAAGSYDMVVRNNTFGGRPILGMLRCSPVPICEDWWIAPDWGAWTYTNGKNGVEPPEPYKGILQDLYRLHQEYVVESDPDKRLEIQRKTVDIHADSLLYVGSVERPYDHPAVWYNGHSARMGNVSVPEAGEFGYTVGSSWYLKDQ